MKHLILALFISFVSLSFGDSFYTLTYTRLDGTSVSLSSLQGKKLILFPFNGASPDMQMLRQIDSLQKTRPDSLAVIAFPALDFDSVISSSYLAHIHDSLGLGLTFGLPGYVKKSSVQGQLSIFQWLTNMNRNAHFNRDVETEGQIFVISPKGTLYSVIEKQLYPKVLPIVLSQKVYGE